jgi:hypothetical protein
MGNTTIGTVQVVLSAQHEKMTKAFGEASKQVAAFKNTIVGLVGAWAGVATARAAVSFIKHNMDVADAMEDQAEQIGVTVRALGGLQLAAVQTGMTAEKFGASMGKLQQAMVAGSHGSAEIESALRSIGLSMDELKGKGADEQLAIIADRFAVTGDASLAAATAVKLFGKGGIEMIPILNGGAAGLAQAAKDAEQFGIALSGVEIGQITEAKGVLAQVESVVESLGLRITAELSPYITELGHYFLNSAREANGFRSQIAAFVEGGVRGAVAVYDTWMRLREVWSAVRIGVMWMTEKVLGAVNNIIITGKLIANVWNASWDLIKASAETAVHAIKHSFQGMKLGLLVVLDNLGGAAAAMIQRMADAAGYVSESLSASLASASKALSDTTGEMRKEASQDFVVTGVMMKNAASDTADAVRNLGAAFTTLPEGNARIAEWRANLTSNMQAEVETLNQIDTERLANVAKVEAAIVEIKSQAQKRAEEIEKGKQARIAAGRKVVDAETIEAERKKHIAIAGETASFFGNIEAMTAAGSEKSKALFYVNKAAAMAQAVVNAWMAYSNTLASPALISSPYLAQGFASAALASGLVAAANIAGQSAPGRANGGPVGRGGMYEVNERGPEMLTVGDKSFLMMGNRSGHVTPGGPGGSSPKVEVHVHTPPGMASRTEQGTGEGGAPRIDVIIEAVSNRVAGDIASGVGPVSKTMQNTYGLNRSRGSSR